MANPPESLGCLDGSEANATTSGEPSAHGNDYPRDATIHELFAARAERAPSAVAAVLGDEQLTYEQLDDRARRLAEHLRSLGAGPESLIGICVERSFDLLIGLLGILYAGGAYVPIDPTSPPERLRMILADARLTALVAQRHRVGSLPLEGARMVLIDDERLLVGSAPAPRPLVGSAENLAIVSYTSGSTGAPKGVSVVHRGVVRLVMAGRYARFSADEVCLQLAPIAFDASTFEIWGCLLHGAKLVLMPKAPPSLEELACVIRDQRVTTMWLTAPLFHRMVDHQLEALRGVRQLLAGGDVLSPPHVRRLLEAFPGNALVNGYGPTENTTFTCCHVMRRPHDAGGATVPIGQPIEQTEVCVLDDDLDPVRPGEVGELYAGGDGLARGYLNRPELTAERFIPDPRAGRQGARLYRTGDTVRERPDGALEFLGRRDHQVKIRGFRVELGEIEVALGRHPALKEAVVAAPADAAGERFLVAYVVPRDATPRVDDLRAFLSQRLPGYMLPSTFVVLSALPLQASGKVDRGALPQATPPARGPAGAPAAPPGSLEERVADIWTRALRLDGGVRLEGAEDFFALGGHSLAAMEILSRVHADLAVQIPLRTLLEGRTLAALTAEIRARGGAPVGPTVEEPEPCGWLASPEARYEPFPLTEVQEAYWIGRTGALPLGEVSAYMYTDVACEDLDLPRFEAALRALISRHEMLRAIVQADGTQRILPEVPPYRVAVQDLRGLPEAAVEERIGAVHAAMSHQVLVADRWPLFELRASVLDERRTLLHIGIDALICDDWSMQIMSRELARLYEDPAGSLQPLSLSYRDYVLAEIALRGSAPHRRAEEYWKQRMRELPPPPELPLAQSPTSVRRPRFVRRSARLDASAWRQLSARAQRAGVTPSGVLLAAYAQILATWSRSPRFTLNLTLFNRFPLHPQVEDVVGDFTSLTLLGVDASGGHSFEAFARRLQEQLWRDLDHRHVGGVRVMREMARSQGAVASGPMPVVFTSTLALPGQAQRPGQPRPSTWWLGVPGWGITQTPQIWLDHQVAEDNGGLFYYWDSVEELFPPGLLDDMFGAYGALLDRLATEEASWVEAAWRRTPAAQLAQRAQVNATAAPVSGCLLHEPFLEQARRVPHALAVVTPSHALTYRELEQRGAQIGHFLRRAGVKPNTLVAVCMEKGWEQVVGVLGILLAGAAYLPVDPSLPTARLHHLLSRGQVGWVLTQPWLNDSISWPEGPRRLNVSVEPLPGEPATPPEPAQAATDLAYVIFTSGSTGLPKGVMIDHRGALNTVSDINARFGVGPRDRVLGLSALSFDLSVYDIFGTLGAGGALVLPSAAGARDPAHWAEVIARRGVTVWNSVPTLMELAVEYAASRPGSTFLRSLRLLLLSGDWIPVTLPGRAREQAPEAQIVSLGGATEASIWSILFPIKELHSEWKSIPYGKPMVNQVFHVLDEALRPVPIWVPGELYIGGVGVAQGYWCDEDRTRAQFIVDPRTGERLYRTGDLGRYLPDGNIEFLGREDAQVKVAGHRVELGEIEAALSQHPGVASAVVAAPGEAGKRRLIAYFVARGQPPPVEELRRLLVSKLPDTMVPSTFVELTDLGAVLSPNGKINRGALPPPPPLVPLPPTAMARQASPHAGGEPAGPLSGVRRRIVEVVAGILRLDRVPQDADLLALGVSSVEVIRLATILERELRVRPQMEELFRLRTLDEVCEFYEAQLLGARPRGGMMGEGAWSSFQVVLDPEERESFKEQRRGQRKLAGERTPLPGGAGVDPRALERASHRSFVQRPIELERFASLLSCLRVSLVDGKRKWAYASAGATYSVQTYVHARAGAVEGLPGGSYYYGADDHQLVEIARGVELDRRAHFISNRVAFDAAAFSLFLVCDVSAIAPLYGSKSLPFTLIEAGLMSQLLEMSAASCGLGLCQIGDVEVGPALELLRLGEGHVLLHSLVGGLVDWEMGTL